MTDEHLLPRCGIRLTDLPHEIGHKIMLEAIGYDHNKAYLASLCLVSHRFQEMIEPFLYHTLTIDVPHCAQGPSRSNLKSSTLYLIESVRQHALLRTLDDRPTLRSLIRSLYLRSRTIYNPDTDEHHLAILELFPLLRELHLGPLSLHRDLPLMPNLRILHLDFSSKGGYLSTDITWEELRKAKMNALSRIFQIPTLQRLRIDQLFTSTPDAWQSCFKCKHRAYSLTDIHILDCADVNIEYYKSMILSIRTLKSFILEIRSKDALYADEETFWSAMELALEPHQDSLEELMIATSDEAELEPTLFTCNFTKYHALKRLAIPENVLVGSEGGSCKCLHLSLPPSLEELQLEHCLGDAGSDHGLEDEIALRTDKYKSLAHNNDHRLRALKRVVWWYQKSYIDDYDVFLRQPRALPEMLDLARDFHKMGVRFQWGWASRFLATPFGTELGGDSPYPSVSLSNWGSTEDDFFKELIDAEKSTGS